MPDLLRRIFIVPDRFRRYLSCVSDFLQKRVVKNFSQVDPEYGRAIQEQPNKLNAKKKVKVSTRSHPTTGSIWDKVKYYDNLCD